MGLFKNLFGSSNKDVQPKKNTLLPLPQRPEIQTVTTITKLSYSVIRNKGCDGTRIDHYTFRDSKGSKIQDFDQMLWLFGLMEKGIFQGTSDFKR